MTDEIKPEDARNVLAENTAQTVRKHLVALERNRQVMQTRWIWELLQNARDAQASMASIECNDEYVEFRHDGNSFTKDEIAHLIYHGSTKTEDEGAIGQYGSGFLTTHLLSSSIHVSGRVDTGNFFSFLLKREVGSAESLKLLMEDAREKFNESLSTQSAPLDDFTTEFRYPIQGDRAEVAWDGIKTLERCAPWALAFNQFSSIEIKSPDKIVKFKVSRNPWENGLQEIVVSKNEIEQERILMVEDEDSKTSVAIPVQKESTGGGRYLVCDVVDMPKLFLGFPLVNTDDFSFPAVINSFQFTPTEDRDGVYLETGTDNANERNQRTVEVAWNLLINLLKSAAAYNFRGIYKLVSISPIPQHKWLKREWLQEVNERFVAEIRKTPAVVVVGGTNSPIPPESAILPVAGIDDGVGTLWRLLSEMQENDVCLPEKEAAAGWCSAINSWMKVSDRHSDIGFNCQKLAAEIDSRHAGQTKFIESALRLKHGVNAINWLNRFHSLIEQDGLRNAVGDYRIVPAQDGQLRKLSDLHRDAGVDGELKDIAELLGWSIRGELRDIRVDSLDEKYGAGDLDNERVVKRLIEKLRARGDANPDDRFAEASVGIFKWISDHEDWNRLIDFPAFAEKNRGDGKMHVIKMQRLQGEDGEYPYLAPVPAWAEDLQHYSDLFPKSCVLATAFFDAVTDSDVWKHLNEDGFAKNCVTIKTAKKDLNPVSDDDIDGKHPPATGITVTDIAFLQKKDIGIMARVPKSRPLARLFWRFLADWLLVQDPRGLENQSAECADCKEMHGYSPAEWLAPVKENKWVPVGNQDTARANAESLGNLLRDTPEAESLGTEGARNLLSAIGVNDINTLLFASNKREHQETLLGWLGKVKSDEKLFDRVEKVMKDNQKVLDNQNLGKQVENLVKEGLADAGFAVRDTGRGSDIEIEIAADIGDAITLELTHPRENQTWLVEVKATSGNAGVKMTLTQAKEARDKGEEYLLCAVPLDGDEPDEDTVRDKMRFVPDIGNDVDELVGDFDEFKDRRDSITADKDRGVQLSISPGTERILVKKSVWEDRKRGFPLNELAERLKRRPR